MNGLQAGVTQGVSWLTGSILIQVGTLILFVGIIGAFARSSFMPLVIAIGICLAMGASPDISSWAYNLVHGVGG